ncbi:VCBS domain-containing protein [Devosia chinhatensis]|uniref:Cadherin domain-containing protein n=1 Tax=Devosia chinhatensis TaxID=429727 RepID=A0A0F5FMJ9_9HYPH|nr:VCBS domain-containing protein [Devosia chinhatensis]KKB09800.1 hypothetical protein VE26_08075 [Devosia chinhatensis]
MAFEVTSVVAKVWNGSAFVADNSVNRTNIGAGGQFQLTVTFSASANTAFTPIFYFNGDENPAGVLNFISGVWSNANKTYTITYGILDDATFQIDDIDLNVTNVRSGTNQDLGVATIENVFSVDLAMPAASAPDLLAASDSGASNSDNLTNDTTPTVRVTLPDGIEAGDTVRILTTSGILATFAVNAGHVSAGYLDVTLILTEGTHALSVAFEDPAGNKSVSADSLTIVVDTSVDAPVFTGGNTPVGQNVVLTGTVDPDATTTISVNGVTYSANDIDIDANGNFTLEIDAASFAADGLPIPVVITTTDLAGNTSALTSSITVGLEGNNVASSTAADEDFNLGAGRDTVQFLGTYADSTITLGAGEITVSNAADGTDTLSGVEILQFVDTTVLVVDATPGYEGYTSIQSALAAANAGTGHFTILVRNGDYTLTSTLTLSKSIAIVGESEAGVKINAAAVSGYGILVEGDGVSLSNFSLTGPAANAGSSYGIKVEPNSTDPADRLLDFALSHVTVSGSGRSEIDLNGVNGAVLSNVTANGLGTAGVGIAMTNSANVELNHVSTSGNNWGSVALYPSVGPYNQAVDNIEFTGTFSTTDAIGVFVQTKPGAAPLGDVSFPPAWSADGDGVWTVVNAAHRPGGEAFTFFFADRDDAEAFAAVLEGVNGNTNSVVTGPDGVIYGSVAIDTLHIDGTWADFTISEANGVYTLTDTRAVPEYDAPILVNGIANFAFSDGTMPVADLRNDDPSGITLGALTLAEDAATGTIVGQVTGVADADGAFDAHTFEIVGGDGRFAIDAVTGVITVADGGFDFETEASIDITIRATDVHGAFYDTSVTIGVTDVNEAPAVSLANVIASIAENTDTTTSVKVADIVITDDALGTNSLSLSGANASLFEIVANGNAFELHIKAGTVINYEALAELNVSVTVADATLPSTSDSVALALSVDDVNEAPVFGFNQSFDANTAGIQTLNGAYGAAVVVASGTNGIASPDGSSFAILTQTAHNGSNATGPYTFFDGKHSEFVNGLTASTSVYLDTNWANGEGFDYSVSALKADGTFLRDFIFHVSKDTSSNALLVGGSNNTNFAPRQDLDSPGYVAANGPAFAVTQSGWYTLQHTFKNAGGVLAVELSLLDQAGTVLWSLTKSALSDLIAAGPGWPGAGGVNYGWFTNIDVTGGIAVDQIALGDYTAKVTELLDGADNEGTEVHVAKGVITFRDVDAGDSHTVSVTAPSGALGSLSASVVNADGDGEGFVAWTFSVADADIEHLKGGETLTQTFTLTLTDAAGLPVTQDVTVTLVGTNDAPVITGDVSKTVSETDAALTITGTAIATDVDADESGFEAASGQQGTNGGTFSIDADGNWTYVANSAYDNLAVGQSFVDSFIAKTIDGTEQLISVTIEGTNDAPVIIAGGNTGTAWEAGDAINNLLSAATNGTFDLSVDYSATILAEGVPHSRQDIDGLISALMNAGAGEAEAIAAVWDHYDDNFGGYSAPPRDEAMAWLGVYYADYLKQNKQPLTFVASKYAADSNNSGAPDRLQPLHDNLLGNLWWQDLQERLDQKGTATSYADIVAALTAVDPAFSTLSVSRYPYSGNEGVVNTAKAYDLANGLVPSLSGQLSATDVDDGDVLTWSIADADAQGLYGTLVVNADGSWNYVLDEALAGSLNAGESASDTFTVTVTDGKESVSTSVTINVLGTNDAPVAQVATAAVDEDATIDGAVTANDVDAGQTETLTFELVGTAPAGLTFNADGTYSFDASSYDALGEGEESDVVVTFIARDANGAASAPQTLTITVTGKNDAPTIDGPSVVVGRAFEAAQLKGIISAETNVNISGIGNFTHSFSLSTDAVDAMNGLLVDANNVSAVLDLLAAEVGGRPTAIAVLWDFLDANYGSYVSVTNESFLRLGVEYIDYLADGGTPFTEVIAKFSPTREQSLHDNLLGNFNWDDVNYRFPASTPARQEIITLLVNAELVDPAVAADLVDFAQYGRDNLPAGAGVLTRPVFDGNLNNTNNPNGVLSRDWDAGTPYFDGEVLGGKLVAEDVDANDEITWSTDPLVGTYGTLTVDAFGNWSYLLDADKAQTLAAGQSETDAFVVTASDGKGGTASVTIEINVHGANDAAKIVASADEDLAVVEAGGVNNADLGDAVAGGTLTVMDVDTGENVFAEVDAADLEGAYGSFTFDSQTGAWTYVLDQDKADILKDAAIETLVVKSLDGTASYTITVNVTGTNDAPVASVIANATAEQDQAFSFTVDAFTDVDDAVLSYEASLADGSPLPAWLSFDPVTLTFSGTPANGDIGTLSVKVTALDADNASASATFEIEVGNVNDAPEFLFTGSLTINEDEIVYRTAEQVQALVDAYVRDIDGDDVTVTVEIKDGDERVGYYVYPEDGDFDFTPPSNFNGSLTVIITLDDGKLEANSVVTKTLTLAVNAVDDLVAEDDAFDGLEDEAIEASVAANDSTTSGGTLSYELVSSTESGDLVFNADGSFVYQPEANASGVVSFTYKVTDAEAREEAVRTVTLTIAAVNDSPTHTGALTLLTNEDADQATLDLLAGAVDVDGDTLSVANVTLTGPSAGVSVVNNSVSINPNAYNYLGDGQSAVVTISYKIVDGNGGSVDRTATITIEGRNELVVGSDFDDVGLNALQGSNFADTIYAGDGDDTVYGGSGDDIIYGEAGDDSLYGGSGNDTIYGGDGDDYIEGGSGDDYLLGGAGDDEIRGGAGSDRIEGGLGRDMLYGGNGNDIFIYRSAADSEVGAQRDVIADFSSGDKIDLRDLIPGGDDGFTFLGRGTATRTMEFGNLKYYYYAGDTYIVGSVDGDKEADFQIRLLGEHVLTSANFLGVSKSIISGTGNPDTLVGTSGNDIFLGGRGADVINGNGGSDTYLLLSTSDSRVGAEGRDVLTNWNSTSKIDISAIDANTKVDGHQEFLFVGQGAADRSVGTSQIKYYHSGGNTFVVGDTNGDGDADFQVQLNGIHHLTADNFVGVKPGVIIGTSAGDRLAGTTGNDIFVGGLGRDVLGDDDTGGLGSDRFVFLSKADSVVGSNRDVIRNWDSSDVIDLTAIDANASVSGHQRFIFDGDVPGTPDTIVEQGHIKFYHVGTSTFIVANTGTGNQADFQIALQGIHFLTAENFDGLL